MTLKEFINKYKGKRIDFDGFYGVQCVDLIDKYISEVLQLTIGFYGNAKYWWLNRNYSEWLKHNFYFITPEYKDGETRPGDIGIRTSGTYGHIFIIADINNNGYFNYYDQNGTGTSDCMTLRKRKYNNSYINGILRPKNQVNIGGNKMKKYGNGEVLSDCSVYSDSKLTNKIGFLYNGDRVLYLGTGNNNPILAYKVDIYYKVGFINKTIKIIRD